MAPPKLAGCLSSMLNSITPTKAACRSIVLFVGFSDHRRLDVVRFGVAIFVFHHHRRWVSRRPQLHESLGAFAAAPPRCSGSKEFPVLRRYMGFEPHRYSKVDFGGLHTPIQCPHNCCN
jgi:hypothetical protein